MITVSDAMDRIAATFADPDNSQIVKDGDDTDDLLMIIRALTAVAAASTQLAADRIRCKPVDLVNEMRPQLELLVSSAMLLGAVFGAEG